MSAKKATSLNNTPKQRTLMNYFSKAKNENETTPKSTNEATPKEGSARKSPDENLFITPTSSTAAKKRQRILMDDDSPIKPITVNSEKRRRIILSSDEEDNSMEVEKSTPKLTSLTEPMEVPKTPVLSKNVDARTPTSSSRRPLAKQSLTPMAQSFRSEHAESFISSFRAEEEPDTSVNYEQDQEKLNRRSVATLVNEMGDARFKHLEFDFLKPEKIRDAKKRRPDDPEYDPKTLYIPEDFLSNQTPSLQQWWRFKSEHFDTILFFKTGKFYELHHMDAVVAAECLNLSFMKDKDKESKRGCKCGFPEIAYGRFADQLLSRGYKVARIEQVETPDELSARNKNERSKDKVVRREICQITTMGTRTYGVLDGNDDANATDSAEATNLYLMAITEKVDEHGISSYGVCFIDTSLGKFKLSQFNDDASRSYIRTLIAHNQPVQLLYERNGISQATQTIFNTMLSATNKEALKKEREFLTAEKTLSVLTNVIYLGNEVEKWPETLRKMLTSAALPQAKPNYALCISSLGAVLWYLKRCLIDVDMVSMKDFEEYLPPSLVNRLVNSQTSESQTKNANRWRAKHLVLDGITLQNLHVVPPVNSKKGAGIRDPTALKHSLYGTINKCLTPFGKRLLRQWLCAPSCCEQVLKERQESVQFLLKPEATELKSRAVETLRKLPDLERLLQKVHTMGLKYRATQHPDSRAKMFEDVKLNKRKINDFINVLSAFENIVKFIKFLPDCDIHLSTLLDRCIGEKFPDINDELEHFRKTFDKKQALEDGKIIPKNGMDAEYDDADEFVRDCQVQLDEYLAGMQKRFGSKQIKFTNVAKDRYLLEFPEEIAKKLGKDFEFKSKRKGFIRYMTRENAELITHLNEAEARRDAISDDMTRRIFADFANRNAKWSAVVSRIAVFDCILSLARYAEKSGLEMCRPEIIFDSNKPFLDIKSGYHPSLVSAVSSAEGTNTTYIPNDTMLGGDTPLTMLLTGPNMGGKSTLMRQVAALVILAQIGSMVPAKFMKFTPVDRIFSRIGANDRLMAGQSTFFVELNETNTILQEATQDALVVIDELGRGTSTHDGTAIAAAVLADIADRVHCRTFFSTHYHAICNMPHLLYNSNILMAHMACVVENEDIEDPTLENVTFLYTLKEGIAKKSYGFSCATRSGIRKEVVRNACAASRMLGQKSTPISKEHSAKLNCIRESAMKNEISLEELQNMIAAL